RRDVGRRRVWLPAGVLHRAGPPVPVRLVPARAHAGLGGHGRTRDRRPRARRRGRDGAATVLRGRAAGTARPGRGAALRCRPRLLDGSGGTVTTLTPVATKED